MPLWTRGSESTGTMATSEARIGAAAGSVGNADFEIQSGSERACLERCDTRFHVPLGKALPLLRFLLEHYRGNSTVFLEAEKKVPLTYSRIREVNGAAAAEALFGTKDLLEKSNLTNETEPQETKSNGGDQDCCGQNCSAGAMEAAFCRREDCWCRTLLSLRGSLAIPVNPCSSGSLEAIEEEARKVAAVLRTGSQDHLSLTEGLLTRAILDCTYTTSSPVKHISETPKHLEKYKAPKEIICGTFGPIQALVTIQRCLVEGAESSVGNSRTIASREFVKVQLSNSSRRVRLRDDVVYSYFPKMDPGSV